MLSRRLNVAAAAIAYNLCKNVGVSVSFYFFGIFFGLYKIVGAKELRQLVLLLA